MVPQEEGEPVLVRLPLRYRVAVWVAGLLSFAGIGAWLAHTTDIPLVWSSGAAVGVPLGALAIAAFLHLLTSEPHAQRKSTNSAR
jgi:hypothetical protein